MKNKKIAILGAGSLGMAITDGLFASGLINKDQIILNTSESTSFREI